MKRLLTAAFLCAIPAAFATDSVTATITSIEVNSGGNVIIYLSSGVASQPACVNTSDYSNAYGFSANNAAGQALLQTALLYKGMGRVIAYGNGTCNLFGNVEDLRVLWGQ
jgi:hypothetical protein